MLSRDGTGGNVGEDMLHAVVKGSDMNPRSDVGDAAYKLITEALQLIDGWREAIAELEDWCHEPVRLKNMVAALGQLDEWKKKAKGWRPCGDIVED